MGTDALRTDTGPSRAPCARSGYGVQPGVHDAVRRYAEAVTDVLATAEKDEVPDRVCALLGDLLETPDLLDARHRESAEETYRRHVLYADAEGRFTVLALVWRPGQTTSVHGHTTWGAVGVYEGNPSVRCYDCKPAESARIVPQERSDERFGPGATCAVRPGYDDVHRIYNDTDETIITIHTYGRDLVAEPESINLDIAD
jgi:predicted metal-dependent enzyme (double-stranded beta helix superfamily)